MSIDKNKKLKEWYKNNKKENSVAYCTWWVRIQNGEDRIIALDKRDKPKNINTKPKVKEKFYNKWGEMSLDVKNIVSTKEEYNVILNAYDNQINSYSEDSLDEIREKEKLIREKNYFVLSNQDRGLL